MDATAASSFSSLLVATTTAPTFVLLPITAEDDDDVVFLLPKPVFVFVVAFPSSSPMVNPTCRTIGCGLDDDDWDDDGISYIFFCAS
jgi:hypothetical protein